MVAEIYLVRFEAEESAQARCTREGGTLAPAARGRNLTIEQRRQARSNPYNSILGFS
jgi:hypothetical protein